MGVFFASPLRAGISCQICAPSPAKAGQTRIAAPDKLHLSRRLLPRAASACNHQRRPAAVRSGAVSFAPCSAPAGCTYNVRSATRTQPQRRKAPGTGKTQNTVLQAAFALCAEHHRRQQRGGVRGKTGIGCGVHISRRAAPRTVKWRQHRLPALRCSPLQNLQRRIQPGCAARQFHPAARRCHCASQCGGDDAVCHRRKGAARRQRLPCTRMVSVPAPSTQPPQALRKAARSTISGSFAAPCSTVCPQAVAAASSSVSVAPTLGKARQISAPRSPAGA